MTGQLKSLFKKPLEVGILILFVISVATVFAYRTPTNTSPSPSAPIDTTQIVNQIQTNTQPEIQDTEELPIYIVADLTAMRLDVVQGITPIKTYTIVSKGKPGSYYETPAGEYEIQLKKESHFSSFGEVYMPYSMQFFGNFFIHGIPYYPDGTRVSSTYSGGCIRLADEDARELYNIISTGTRVIVKADTEPTSNGSGNIEQAAAQHMLTNLISLEFLNQERFVTFENKEVKIKDLLGPIANGNVEAISLIQNTLGYNRYHTLTEQKAKALGLSSALFDNQSDREVFYSYIKANRSYLLQFLNQKD